jgi:hypothetical protein
MAPLLAETIPALYPQFEQLTLFDAADGGPA